MPALPEQLVRWDWTGLNTDDSDRKVQLGELREAKNVWRDEKGVLIKRPAYEKTATSAFVGGSHSTPVAEMVPSSAPLWRDAADGLWVRNGTEGRFIGTDRGRLFPRYRDIKNQADEGRASKPRILRRGNELWIFHLGATISGVEGYALTVMDATTHQVISQSVDNRTVASDITGYAITLDALDNVWLFFVRTPLGPTVIKAHKWTAAGTYAGETDFATVAGMNWVSVDASLDPTSGEVTVVATSAVEDTPMEFTHYHALLNSATGAAKASPAPVVTTVTGGDPTAQPTICSGVRIAKHDGADGFFYYAFARAELGGDPYDVDIVRVKASVSTLAISTTVTLETRSMGDATDFEVAQISGYLDAGIEHWCSTLVGITGAGSVNGGYDIDDDVVTDSRNVSSAVTRKHVVTGGTPANSDFARGAILASDPFQIGTAWHFLTSFGDAGKVQRAFFVRDTNGNIVVPVLDGEGVEPFHNGGLSTTAVGGTEYNQRSGHVIDVVEDDGGRVAMALLRDPALTLVGGDPVLATLADDDAWRSMVDDHHASGIPKLGGPHDKLRELSPLQFPAEPLTIEGNGEEITVHSTNVVSYRYLLRGSDDRADFSDARAIETLTFLVYTAGQGGPAPDYTLRVPTLRHVIGEALIVVYGSVDGDTVPYIQRVLRNDPTVDYIDISVRPLDWMATGESLDTLGGALAPAPLPPARLVNVWKNRAWLFGTPYGQWFSQERTAGRGWEFNEALVLMADDVQGEPTAACTIDDDTQALFFRDAIVRITGPGPDGNGIGSFVTQRSASKISAWFPNSVAQGPLGAYFQDGHTGRFYVIGPAGPPVDISKGLPALGGATVVRGVNVEGPAGAEQNLMKWFLSSGKVLVLDYGHALPDQPAGQWYLWESAGLDPMVGAELVGGVEVGIDASANTWQQGDGYDEDGSQVLKDFQTGRMAPAGMMGEFDTDWAHISSEEVEAGSSYTYTLTNDQGAAETHADPSNSTSDVSFRSARFRTREVRMRIQETAGSGAGRKFDGVAMIVRPYGRLANTRRRI